MRKSFSTGLVILLPFVLTLWVFNYLFDLFTNPFYHLIEKLLFFYEQNHNYQMLLHILSRFAALILTFLLILFLGYVGRKFFFHSLMKSANQLIFKIPIVGALYKLTKDITKAMLSSDQKTFKETTLIPFPSQETFSVGFITGDIPAAFKEKVPALDVNVFVPTAPHPISGYVLLASRSSLQPLNISVEETFKFLLSCGVVHPKENRP